MKKSLSQFFWIALLTAAAFSRTAPCEAIRTPHPIQLYDQGQGLLSTCDQEPHNLIEAQQVFQRLMVRYPDSPLGYLGMSQVMVENARLNTEDYNMTMIHEQALPYAIQALELGNTLRLVHEQYSRIESIFDHYNESKRIVDQAEAEAPGQARTLYLRAVLSLQQNDIPLAAQSLRMALDRGPDPDLQVSIIKQLAWMNLQRYGDMDRVLELCQQGLAADPQAAELYKYQGLARIQKGDYLNAVESLTQAWQLDPGAEREYLLLFAQGRLAEQSAHPEEAITLFEQAARIRGKSSDVHLILGNLYFDQGRYAPAYDHFQRVIDLAPDQASAYFFAGRSAESLGRPEAAMDYFRKYLSLEADAQKIKWIQDHVRDLSQK